MESGLALAPPSHLHRCCYGSVISGERPLPVFPDRVVPMWQTGSQVTDGKQEKRYGRAAGSS